MKHKSDIDKFTVCVKALEHFFLYIDIIHCIGAESFSSTSYNFESRTMPLDLASPSSKSMLIIDFISGHGVSAMPSRRVFGKGSYRRF